MVDRIKEEMQHADEEHASEISTLCLAVENGEYFATDNFNKQFVEKIMDSAQQGQSFIECI